MSVLLALLPLLAQTPSAEYVKANYTKYEHRIPMRDGKRLFTAIYVPKDAKKTYPFLLSRTPYSVSPYGVSKYRAALGPSELFQKSGYIFVYQDVRSRYMSEGVFVEMTPHLAVKRGPNDIDESTDTFDTIDWLVKHIPGNNGKAGIVGISYPGFYAAAGMIDAHPALKAASPQAPIIDLFGGDDAYHNGAFYLAANFGFYAFFGKKKTEPELPNPNAERFDFGTRDGYDFYRRLGPLANANEKFFKQQSPYWSDLLAHTTYDSFWQERNLTPHIRNVSPAVLTVGGWYDAEDLQGPLRLDSALTSQSSKTSHTLVMGPWVHGGWSRGNGDKLGSVSFNAKTAPWFREHVEFPFFEHHLKEKADPKLARAIVFETGTNRWRHFSQWPPTGDAKTLYFLPGGKLSLSPPSATGAFSEYTADPAKPVPFVGFTTLGMAQEYMVSDQRFASTRPDVLTFVSDSLEEDLILAGPLRPQLYLESTATDADFVVKLIDVYPDDTQQLLRGEPFRAKFRESMSTPKQLVPGQGFEINFTMPDLCHSFRRGHRLMVQIQSSWFPLVDLHPQRFGEIPNMKSTDFQKATHKLFHDSRRPSGIHATTVGLTR